MSAAAPASRRRRWPGAGFDVLGIDAAAETIAAADVHAAGQGLRLAYRVGAPERCPEGARFPVVTALEVIEHVPDPAAFAHAGRPAATRGPAVSVHAEPHHAILCFRQGRRGISAPLAAGRHA